MAIIDRENIGFNSLLLSSSISTVGDGIRTLVIPLIILYLTGSTFLFGLIYSAEFLIWIISTGFTGYFVDRRNRVKSLSYSNFVMFLLMTCVSISFFVAYSYFLLFIVIALIGTSIGQSFYNPSSFSLLPDIVHKDLDRHNALISMCVNVSMIGGYVVAGLGFSIVSWGVLLSIDALSFLISAIIATVGLRKYSRNEKTEKVHFWKETKETFSFLKPQKVILYTIGFGFVFNFLTSGMVIILPTIAVENTSIGSISLSLFYITELIGMVLGGSLIAVKKNRRLVNYLLVGSLGQGLVMVIIGLSLFVVGIVVIVVSLILLVDGFFSEILNIPLMVWYQELVPRDKRAKVINLKDLILTIPMVVSTALMGYLLDYYSEWLVIFIFGISAMIISILEYAFLKPLLRNFRVLSQCPP
ncbi:MAG: MFS transporter [Cuniculiplasma sp.]